MLREKKDEEKLPVETVQGRQAFVISILSLSMIYLGNSLFLLLLHVVLSDDCVLQMLQVVTERLLQPVLTLTYQTHCVERFSQLSDSANSLLDLLLATLFHQSVNSSHQHGWSVCLLGRGGGGAVELYFRWFRL